MKHDDLPSAQLLADMGKFNELCQDPRTRFLQKPFSAQALKTMVRALLR